MKMKCYIYFFLALITALLTGCTSYNYTANVSDTSTNNESTEVYLFGTNSDNVDNLKATTYSDFWNHVFNSNGEYPPYKKVFYFGPGTPTKQTLTYNDNIWNIWEKSDMDYLCIVAYSPNFTDSGRSDTDWKKIIELDHYNWWGLSSEDLNIAVNNGVINIDN